MHFPGMSTEAASFLTKKREIAGVGINNLSIDPGYGKDYTTFKIISSNGKWILECIANLKKIPPVGAYIFIGAPKIQGATGGLTIIIAIW